ncbi:tripartite tricarboxylate transporter TctB family protein [Halomonas sp. DN3]|uniref:tripartite tricarboxylate transporter TctB family protein n=1 Tax=Halomonas sp. DN3 TaxID=2953657 RepID=UPI00209D37C8|nr:tripartite tricarboxylate transporter TctB family protein [Halomonas sp. DN3]USZ49853.1 tripartite tricarboxylate transporter TctB family protein [Halomonas sp. DN3]
MTIVTRDRVLAVAMLALCGIMYAESGNIRPPTSWQPYGSALFPRLLLGVIAVLALLILLRSLFTKIAETRPLNHLSASEWIKRNHKVLLLFAFFGLYAAVLPYAGYLVSTIAFLAGSMALLLGVGSRRKVAMNLLISPTVALSIYAVFQLGLGIWLP